MIMRPTFRQLEYIVTVGRLGRFGLAAEALNVSQPSLSAQIAAVEEELGVQLFERGRGGVQVTVKGAEFLVRAQRILREVEDLRATMSGGMPFGGRLRLGVLPSIGPYLLPRVISLLHQEQPDLRVIVREENTRDLERGLKSGRFDLIISTPEDHPNTRQMRLFTERFWIALAKDDPLADDRGAVAAKDLRGRIFLTLDRGHRLSRIVYGMASDCGGIVSDEYEGTSLDSVLLMAGSGAGVAVLPELFARQQALYRTEVSVRPLAIDNADRDIALLQRAGETTMGGWGMIGQALQAEAARLGFAQEAGQGA